MSENEFSPPVIWYELSPPTQIEIALGEELDTAGDALARVNASLSHHCTDCRECSDADWRVDDFCIVGSRLVAEQDNLKERLEELRRNVLASFFSKSGC